MVGDTYDSVRSPVRLAILDRAGPLQIPADPTINHLTHLAASALRVPAALVVLVGVDRAVLASSVGLPDPLAEPGEIVLPHSPPTYVAASGEPLVIGDARIHPVMRKLCPLPGLDVGAFLGMPLTTTQGSVLGAICAIDHRPRSWNTEDVAMLKDLAVAIVSATELAGTARSANRRAEDGFRLLVQASDALASSLDYQATLATVARLAVPSLASWCVVYIVGDDGKIERLALAHADPGQEAALRQLMDRFPVSRTDPRGVGFVVRTGHSLLAPEIAGEALLTFYHGDAEFPDHLKRMGLQGAMVVPLVARGRTTGAMAFGSTRVDHRYDESDLSLAKEIAHRAAVAIDNATLYREARDAIQTRDAVFATVSHDLRAPLGNIKGYAQLLRGLAPTAEPSETELVLHGAERIDAIATRMASMVDDLLDVARVQPGRDLDLTRVPTDLVGLVSQIRDQIQETADRQRLRVVATSAEIVGTWDSARLERMVANLVANAIKYSPNGGEITVILDRADDEDGAWAVLEVSDRGIGIPAGDLPHIFEGFRRGANVVGRYSGCGLGLTSAMQIVRQHRGQISARSQEGIGSTITVRLPLTAETGQADLERGSSSRHR